MKRIIVIGGGIGGLTTANLLAAKGYEVILFEAHTAPGGYVSGFWREGYYFESGTRAFQTSKEIVEALEEIGVYDDMELLKIEPGRYESVDFNKQITSYEDFKDMLINAYPEEKSRLLPFFTEVDRMNDVFNKVEDSKNLFEKTMATFKLIKIFSKYGSISIADFAKEYFPVHSKLYIIIKNHIGYLEPAAWLLGGLSMYHSGGYTPKEGMLQLAEALASKFIENGGEIKYKSHVDRILTEEGKATGVICKGETYYADYIVSSCDYKKTFLELLNPEILPTDFISKIKKAKLCESLFVIYLGLDISYEELKKIMVMPVVQHIEVDNDIDLADANDADFFKKTSFELYSQSLCNPDLAPEGKSSLTIKTYSPHLWMDNWGGGERRKYLELKKESARIILERAGEIIPNLADKIEFIATATPLTFERYTGNSEGASSGWSWSIHDKFYKNPSVMQIRTPIKNLYIGSAWASQLGGVQGAIMSGAMCAKKI